MSKDVDVLHLVWKLLMSRFQIRHFEIKFMMLPHDLARRRLVLPTKRLTTIAKEWPQMKLEQQKIFLGYLSPTIMTPLSSISNVLKIMVTTRFCWRRDQQINKKKLVSRWNLLMESEYLGIMSSLSRNLAMSTFAGILASSPIPNHSGQSLS